MLVIQDPKQAKKALAEEVLKEAKRGRSHYKVAPKEKRTGPDGVVYASLLEMRNHIGLRRLEEAGLIKNLRRQVPYELKVNGVFICRYYADHVYFDLSTGKEVVCDSKGKRTQAFLIKKNLMRACLGIDVVELS